MKKIFLILIALVVQQFASAQTNVYHPFPDSNAVWNVYWNCFGFGEAWLSYTMSGDTAITNYTYHKITKPPIVHIGPCNVGGIAYQGAIREDSSARKVFFVYPFDTLERVLFDFNLLVGDTFPSDSDFCADHPVVQIIDSILIGNNYRKRWIMAQGPQFIEGIGSTWGFLEPSCGFLDFPSTTLLCFRQNGHTMYPDTTGICEIIDFQKDIPGKNFSVTLSPNPFHTSATLQIKGFETDMDNCEIKIYNSMGALVRDEIITGSDYILNRKSFPDGIYFYQLATPKNEPIGSGRFIIE